MKSFRLSILGLCSLVLLSGCGMNNTAKGGLIGGGGGAALGGILGQIIGKNTKSTAIGAAIGAAVGTTAGVLIGKKMDKAKAAAAAVENAQVEGITDANGNTLGVKVTFDSGILFPSSSSTLQTAAKNSLTEFANVLKTNNDADVAIKGYTDNQGWKNSTAEQSIQKNETLSLQRAQSVQKYLTGQGVNSSQIKSVEGLGQADPVADNSTEAGRQQNRRVEVYLYPSQAMIDAANNGTLQ
ncbi:MAG: OmpA family protein [Prevotella sp.]|nr:OmpA family protein [Prevotella sp.]